MAWRDPLAAAELALCRRGAGVVLVWCWQVEVYNEGVYDLLSTAKREDTKLKIRQLPKQIELVGLTKRPAERATMFSGAGGYSS